MRRNTLRLIYNGADISGDIAADVKSFRYAASATDRADTIDVTLADPARKWLRDWRPEAGDKLAAAIVMEDYPEEGQTRTVQCGSYILDEPSYSAPPHVQTLSAISVACNTSLVSAKRSRTWEDAAISEIAAQIAADNGAELYWESAYDPHITMEQSKTADLDFLANLCKKYTLRIKAADGQIVIYDPIPRESAAPVAELTEGGVERYSLTHTYTGTGYTSAEITTYEPETGEYKMMEDTAKYQGLTEEEARKKYEKKLTASAEGVENDPELAARTLKVEAMKEYTAEITMGILPEITEGCAVTLAGFGGWDGAWIVDEITISLPGAREKLKLHRAVTG